MQDRNRERNKQVKEFLKEIKLNKDQDKDEDEDSSNNSLPSIEKAFKFRKTNTGRVRARSTRKKSFQKNLFRRKHTHNQGQGQDMPQDHHQNHQQLQKKHQ